MPETLLFSISDNIATITFNRPAAMNCFNDKMADELERITDQVAANDSVRAVLLNGAGQLFMAGGDIHFFSEALPTMPAGVLKIIRTLNASILNIMHMPKPVLASVHGSVAGVGLSFMLACDLVIAAENTKFTLAYSGIGISPDGGATFNLPRLVGTKKAMEWMLFSDLFDANTAQSYGLVNWVVSREKLAEETNRLLKKLVNGPTQSFAQIKRLLNQTWDQNLASQLESEAKSFARCTKTTDFKNGVKCFLQKSKPEFVGS